MAPFDLAQFAVKLLSEHWNDARRWTGGALRGLRRVPVFHQASNTDCGAACLAMVLAYHGRWEPLGEIREELGIGRDGASAKDIVEAARRFSLNARAVRVDDPQDLRHLPRGSILHWKFDHFVVLEGGSAKGCRVVDPSHGRRQVSWDETGLAFTGVALVFHPDEKFVRGGRRASGMARLVGPLKEHWRVLAKVVVVSLLLQVLMLALPVVTGVVVDRIVPTSDLDLLGILALVVVVVLAYRYMVLQLREYLMLYLRAKLDERLTLSFLGHLVSLPFSFFERRSHGDLSVRLESNSTLREIMTSSVLTAALDGLLVVMYLALLFMGHPGLAWLALSFALVRFVLFAIVGRRTRELSGDVIKAQSDTRSYQIHVLRGIETLKTSGQEAMATSLYADVYRRELASVVSQGRFNAKVNSTMAIVSAGGPLCFLLYGATLVIAESLTLGQLLALAAVATGFWTPITGLVGAAFELQRARSYLERIEDVLTTEPEQSPASKRAPPKLSGHLVVENVSFAYDRHGPLVLDDVSFELTPGQVLGITGRSGSGKSTLAALICGLHKPTRGRILLDGHDLHDLDLALVRQQLGVVLQKPYLFGTTVRANIALGDSEASLERIAEAARMAAVDQDIEAMPMGYDTAVSDLGGSLSGGQMQRLSIARALLTDPAILVMDEATSSLDSLAEDEIFRNLSKRRGTRITVAHRLSTIRHADQILVLRAGKIVESGRHDDLVSLDGVYASLVGPTLKSHQTSEMGLD